MTRSRLRLAATFAVMSVGAVIMLAAAIPTLFLARSFYSEVIGAALGRAILALWGIRFIVHHAAPLPEGQKIYISNHDSTLDVFLLIGMGLPRTRFFMIGWLRKFVPIAVVGTLIRIFWTVPQAFPEKRRRIFMRADRVLRRTGDSVYLSPEGMRVTTGEIGHFNKGAFHLATSLHAPLVPIYIHTPPEINPGMRNECPPGTVNIYFLPAIDTSAWREEDIEINRDHVRDLFVRIHDEVRSNGRLPADLGIATAGRQLREAAV